MLSETNKTSHSTPIIEKLLNIVKELKKFPSKETEKEIFLKDILNNSLEAVIVLNQDSGITYVSENIQDYIGYEQDELLGKEAFEFATLTGFPSDHVFDTNRHQHLSSVVELKHKNGKETILDAMMINLHHNPVINGLLILIKPASYRDKQQRVELIKAIVNAKEQERAYFARELHDNISQLVTVCKLLVERAITTSDNSDLLHVCLKTLLEVEKEIKKLSSSLICHELQDFGLLLSIKKFIETVLLAIPTSFDVNIEPQVEHSLTNHQKIQVYRIIQEALNNIIKHAKASVVSVSLLSNDEKFSLKIRDNGVGLNIDNIRTGVGISSIRNRTKILKGQCQIISPNEQGTLINIEFPSLS
jgi:PAS domain S-box-containing protein